MKKVYFDSAATTQLRDDVITCITEVLKTEYGNPSSTHSYGRSSKSLLENARKEIAKFFNVAASEIIFTSGGTEADNLILSSAVRDLGVKRIISSRIEHHAVLHTLEWLQKEHDIQLDFVKLDECGHVDYDHLEKLLKDTSQKTLVSLMHVNNEIGNLLDLKKVALMCKEHNALFHRHRFPNSAAVHGGEQERGLRAGTEAVYAIAGMAEALKLSYHKLEKERKYITELKEYFKEQLIANIPGVKFNGGCDDNERSTYTLLNVCLPISAEKAMLLLFQLDLKGIACSKGSACQSGSEGGSHVLNEILSDEDLSKPSIRFSFSSFNKKEEVDYVVDVLKEFIDNGIG